MSALIRTTRRPLIQRGYGAFLEALERIKKEFALLHLWRFGAPQRLKYVVNRILCGPEILPANTVVLVGNVQCKQFAYKVPRNCKAERCISRRLDNFQRSKGTWDYSMLGKHHVPKRLGYVVCYMAKFHLKLDRKSIRVRFLTCTFPLIENARDHTVQG